MRDRRPQNTHSIKDRQSALNRIPVGIAIRRDGKLSRRQPLAGAMVTGKLHRFNERCVRIFRPIDGRSTDASAFDSALLATRAAEW